MYDSQGNPIKCKCGKPAGTAAFGKEAFAAWCSDCSPINKESAEFVYRSPNLIPGDEWITNLKTEGRKMEVIKSRRALTSLIKSILEEDPEVCKSNPHVFSFSEGLGSTTYHFNIEKTVDDHFIDEKGQKWVKA